METIFEKITEWLKELLISWAMDYLTGIYDSVNEQVGQIADEVGTTPADFSPAVFSMIENLSETVILPIAGVILTFIACYELIQMIIEHNNLASFETWTFFKWIFKTAVAVLLIASTFDITMAVFDLAQEVVAQSSSLITDSTTLDDSSLSALESTLEEMELGELLGVCLQVTLVNWLLKFISVGIFVVIYGRMIEIYCAVSLAPLPFATFGNREQSQIGQNYLKSLLALGLQGFLIMVCVGIYAVMIQSISYDVADNITSSLWSIVGFSVLLLFTLFKTGSIAKSVLGAR